jgi:LysM repeat protein
MVYIVQSWEPWVNIDTIASRFGVTVDQMMKANPILYSAPVRPGMFLDIPGKKGIGLPAEGFIEYVVQPDDTLYGIANKFKLNFSRVIAQNPQIDNPNVIWPGQVIYLIYSGH